MRKSVFFVVAALAGTFVVPLALMHGLAEPSAHTSSGIPVQLVIVWALLAVIALGLTFAVIRMVRAR